MAATVPYDARCHNCGRVHIVHVGENEQEGNAVKIVHAQTSGECGEYGKHTLISRLTGLEQERRARGLA